MSQMELSSIESLIAKLSHPNIFNDVGYCRALLSKVMSLTANKSADLSPLMAPMIKLLAHSDLLIKKSACFFLAKSSGCQSELMLLAVNTLLRDLQESNPMIRGLALRTLCSVNHTAFYEHRLRCIISALKDGSSYVRRTAAMACVSVAKLDHETLLESGLLDVLYSLVRDSDPVVAVNCLLALDEVLKTEGGVVVTRAMARYLLSRLEDFTSWGTVYVLQVLSKYTPKSEEEIFDLMNMLDNYLQHNNVTVSVAALELFLKLIKDMPHLTEEIFQRASKSFVNVLSSGNVEMATVVLQYLKQYSDLIPKIFCEHYKVFFCRYKDPSHLKQTKLWFLTRLVNEDTFKEILEEIVMNCNDKSANVSLCAIQALGQFIIKFPELSDSLFKAFKKLLCSETSHILSNTLQVLVGLPVEQLPGIEDLAEQLVAISRQITDPDGEVAVLNLIGRFGIEQLEGSCAQILEEFTERFTELDPQVKGQLLLTGVKWLCRNAGQFQHVFGELLEHCFNDTDSDMRDQASFYYSVLQANMEAAEMVFNDG